MISRSTSLSSLLMQVVADPKRLAQTRSQFPYAQPANDLATNTGFAGVHRSVTSDNYVGSGLNLELELTSGQSITLNIEKNVGGGLRDISFETNGELSELDEEKLKHIFTKIGDTLEAMFLGVGSTGNQNSFDFANIAGVKDIELTAQQDNGSVKQRLQFEKHHSQDGRKEIEAQWSRYNHATAEEEQHNLALSKQPKDVALAYGQMNYQWVLDQVEAGMGILGNAHTGESSLKSRVTDFFASGVQALFSDAQKGQQLLQELGASAHDAKQFIGRTIRALTSDQKEQANNMPGQAVVEAGSRGSQAMNSLPDFKAHFASKRNSSGSADDHYNLVMEISQTTHLTQGATEDDTAQAQFRRLLLKYDSKAGSQEYEYNWRHDEVFINRYKNGMLVKSYAKINDLQQGILSSLDGIRTETSSYMQRREFDANNKNQPAFQNNYIKPDTYTERGYNVNHTV